MHRDNAARCSALGREIPETQPETVGCETPIASPNEDLVIAPVAMISTSRINAGVSDSERMLPSIACTIPPAQGQNARLAKVPIRRDKMELSPSQNKRLRAILRYMVGEGVWFPTISAFGRALGVSQPTAHNWYSGKQGFSYKSAHALAKLLGKPFDEVVGPTHETLFSYESLKAFVGKPIVIQHCPPIPRTPGGLPDALANYIAAQRARGITWPSWVVKTAAEIAVQNGADYTSHGWKLLLHGIQTAAMYAGTHVTTGNP